MKTREIARAVLGGRANGNGNEASEAIVVVVDEEVEAAIRASSERRRRTSAAEHGGCHDAMAEAIEASCGFEFSDYAFKYADVLYTTCEKTGGDADKAVAAVKSVCK